MLRILPMKDSQLHSRRGAALFELLDPYYRGFKMTYKASSHLLRGYQLDAQRGSFLSDPESKGPWFLGRRASVSFEARAGLSWGRFSPLWIWRSSAPLVPNSSPF